jgi:purine nucleosidase
MSDWYDPAMSDSREISPGGRIPLLVDCDTGIDDSLALLYAVASPECELVAVTCTAGNVDAVQVAENTRAVLALAGRSDVEVAVGRPTPLARELITTPETHGPRGIGYAELPPAAAPLSARYSPDLIVEEARRRPGELTLVTLAPLTNVALAVLREPELPRLLRRLVIMGGSYRSSGNTAPTTEWNVNVDPESARIVFEAFGPRAVESAARLDRSAHGGPGGSAGSGGSAAGSDRSAHGGPGGSAEPGGSGEPAGSAEPGGSGGGRAYARPIALGLDVTERAKMLPEHLAALAVRAGCAPDGTRPDGSINEVVRYLADALRFYMEFHSRYDGFYGAFVHDPLALATALDPALVRTEAVTVDVELGGRLTTGETVTDWRRVWNRPPNVDVAVEADAARFMDRFIQRVGDLAARLG